MRYGLVVEARSATVEKTAVGTYFRGRQTGVCLHFPPQSPLVVETGEIFPSLLVFKIPPA